MLEVLRRLSKIIMDSLCAGASAVGFSGGIAAILHNLHYKYGFGFGGMVRQYYNANYVNIAWA